MLVPCSGFRSPHFRFRMSASAFRFEVSESGRCLFALAWFLHSPCAFGSYSHMRILFIVAPDICIVEWLNVQDNPRARPMQEFLLPVAHCDQILFMSFANLFSLHCQAGRLGFRHTCTFLAPALPCTLLAHCCAECQLFGFEIYR